MLLDPLVAVFFCPISLVLHPTMQQNAPPSLGLAAVCTSHTYYYCCRALVGLRSTAVATTRTEVFHTKYLTRTQGTLYSYSYVWGATPNESDGCGKSGLRL